MTSLLLENFDNYDTIYEFYLICSYIPEYYNIIKYATLTEKQISDIKELLIYRSRYKFIIKAEITKEPINHLILTREVVYERHKWNYEKIYDIFGEYKSHNHPRFGFEIIILGKYYILVSGFNIQPKFELV